MRLIIGLITLILCLLSTTLAGPLSRESTIELEEHGPNIHETDYMSQYDPKLLFQRPPEDKFHVKESKDAAEFFSILKKMRGPKSLAIVGKDQKYIYLMVLDNEKKIQETGEKILSRSKRDFFKATGKFLDIIGPKATRYIAVPISLFNYLGYVPTIVPGIPRYIDPGSPDDSYYNYVQDFKAYDNKRYFRR